MAARKNLLDTADRRSLLVTAARKSRLDIVSKSPRATVVILTPLVEDTDVKNNPSTALAICLVDSAQKSHPATASVKHPATAVVAMMKTSTVSAGRSMALEAVTEKKGMVGGTRVLFPAASSACQVTG